MRIGTQASFKNTRIPFFTLPDDPAESEDWANNPTESADSSRSGALRSDNPTNLEDFLKKLGNPASTAWLENWETTTSQTRKKLGIMFEPILSQTGLLAFISCAKILSG
jgi:hypothetical protein